MFDRDTFREFTKEKLAEAIEGGKGGYEEIKMLRERRLDYHVSIERGLMKKVHAAKVPPFLKR